MVILKIFEILTGLFIIVIGYLIYFKHKYNLANDYYNKLEKGQVSEQYAKNIGLIYLSCGALFVLFGALSFMLSDLFTFIQLFVILISIVLLLLTNPKR